MTSLYHWNLASPVQNPLYFNIRFLNETSPIKTTQNKLIVLNVYRFKNYAFLRNASNK